MGNDMGKLGNLSGAGSLKHHLETAEKTGALAFPDKKLTEFPAALSKVADKLRNLDLSRNRIRSLPPIIGSFKMLKTLRLSDNRLTSLPEEMGQLLKLEAVFLAGNQLVTLPHSMAKLKNLKELDASSNCLSTYPEFINSLNNLDTANLAQNKIDRLPEQSMAGLSCTELNLNQNQVSRLPESLASCPRLKTLRLEENCLTLESIPKKLLADSKVSTLSVAGNMFDEKKLSDLDGYEKYLERYTAVKRKLD